MALFDNDNRKTGIQIGTVGDECFECKKKNRGNEEYEPASLDYKIVYKFWVNNISHCLCLDCFKETLGPDYILLNTTIPENAPMFPELEEKPKPKKQNNTKKKEEVKDGSKAAEPSEGK